MKAFLILILVTLPFNIYSQNSECFEECFYDADAFCPALYDPVCGCNGENYANYCFALASGIPSWSTGVCADNTNCENEASISSELFRE